MNERLTHILSSVVRLCPTMAFLFNTSRLLTNWTVSDGNRTWIACDEGSSNTVAGWEQVRFLERRTRPAGSLVW